VFWNCLIDVILRLVVSGIVVFTCLTCFVGVFICRIA